MYRQIRLLVLGGYACLALASASGALWISAVERAALLREGQRQGEGLALAVGEYVGGVLRSADVLMQAVADGVMGEGGPDRADRGALHARLKAHAQRVEALGAVAVYGADLQMRANSLVPDTHGMGGAGREHFEVHRAGIPGPLFIGKALQGPVSRSLLIPITRRLSAPEGRFEGVVAASLPFSTVERFFRRLGLEPSAGLELLRADGEVLLRLPHSQFRFGESAAGTELLDRAPPPGGEATLELPAAQGGAPKLVSLHRHPELPLIVAVTRNTEALLAPWRRPLPARALLLALLLAAAGAFAFDILARARAQIESESSLKRAQAQLAAFFRGSPTADAIVRAEDGVHIDVNDAWERLYRVRRAEALGRSARELGLWVDPSEREPIMAEARAQGTTQGRVVHLRRADGSRFVGRMSVTVAELSGTVHLLISIEDVTAEARALEEVRRLNDTLESRVRERTAELESSNRELEAFSYSVSHDLRAPLRAVTGFAEILLREHRRGLDAQGAKLLVRIGRSARKMGELVDALLEMGRLARQPFLRARVDLSALAYRIVGELREHNRGREVRVCIAPDLEADADPALARSLLHNLLDNAWKYTARTRHARIEFRREGDSFVVRDNGAGFDMRYVNKLFHPFERLHADEDFSGTGIGLALAERIVRRHGGRIRAEGETGRGAAFYFTLG